MIAFPQCLERSGIPNAVTISAGCTQALKHYIYSTHSSKVIFILNSLKTFKRVSSVSCRFFHFGYLKKLPTVLLHILLFSPSLLRSVHYLDFTNAFHLLFIYHKTFFSPRAIKTMESQVAKNLDSLSIDLWLLIIKQLLFRAISQCWWSLQCNLFICKLDTRIAARMS